MASPHDSLAHQESEAESPFQIERSGKSIPVVSFENGRLDFGDDNNSLNEVKHYNSNTSRTTVIAEHDNDTVTPLFYDAKAGSYIQGERINHKKMWDSQLKSKGIFLNTSLRKIRKGSNQPDEYRLHADRHTISTGDREADPLDYRNGEVHYLRGDRYIIHDPGHPEKKFPTIQIEDEKAVTVNGVPWAGTESMAHLDTYALKTRTNGRHTVISNELRAGGESEKYGIAMDGKRWISSINRVKKIELSGDTVAVLDAKGGANKDKGTLYVNDRTWPVAAVLEKDVSPDIDDFAVNDKGRIAAAVTTYAEEGGDGKWTKDVVVGGAQGPEAKWAMRFKEIGMVAQGDGEKGAVAVLGKNEEGKWQLAVNDTQCQELDDIYAPVKLEVQNGGAIVEYVSVSGEMTTARVALKENANELAKAQEANREKQQTLDTLLQLMSERSMAPDQLLKRLIEAEAEVKEASSIEDDYRSQIVVREKQVAETSTANLKMENEIKNLRLREAESAQSLRDINQALRDAQQDIRPARVGKGFVMSEVAMEKIKKAQDLSQANKEGR